MRPTVFLGPSLSHQEAAYLLDADYQPPVKRGDLAAVAGGSPILIIDGEFNQNLSVSPKEILTLLDVGECVIGASSMGALRAAELAPFGMIGIGWVYKAYRSGRVIGDDEVAVMYSQFDGAASTVPLINVRFWLEMLVTQGHLDKALSKHILRRARAIFYADRTESRLHRELENFLGKDVFANLLEVGGGAISDIKAIDARQALLWMATSQTHINEGEVKHDKCGTLSP